MSAADDFRRDLADFLERDLIGPAHGENEELEEPPKLRYLAGVLFPQEVMANESDAVAGVEGDLGEQGNDEDFDADTEDIKFEAGTRQGGENQGAYDDGVTLANRYRPSAMALSFLVEPPESGVRVEVRAALYESRTEESVYQSRTGEEKTWMRTIWRRQPLGIDPVQVDLREAGVQDFEITGGLHLRVVTRAHARGRMLTTMSVYNNTVVDRSTSRTFFQVGFMVTASDGAAAFTEYGDLEGASDSPEDRSLDMLYRERQVFAIGHGCAADWARAEEGRSVRVETAVLPMVEVPPIVPRSGDDRFLSMQFLMGDCENPDREIPSALLAFCSEYEVWIEGLEKQRLGLESMFQGPAQSHIALCRQALTRMKAGIGLLESDDDSLEAFKLMNRAMLMQQHHARLRRKLDDPWVDLPGADDYASDWSSRKGYWRSFQLAFVLIVLPDLLPSSEAVYGNDSRASNRDLVDLIWFPTGGGKTEAYLGAAAFLLFRGRLEDPSRTGCQILMRYTLRLLTSQQFQRAASLMCACEMLRRLDPKRFGQVPFSIGLWVGMSLTPNNEQDALQKLAKLAQGRRDAKNPFQLLSCPWCGTEMNNSDRLGYQERGGRQIFQCPSRGDEKNRCSFSSRGRHLPICVVDESIYKAPPSLLIGTVDKFAMLAWRSDSGSIFKTGGGPELIIQDELHLISGPLGSIVGLYEGVIEYLCSNQGRMPKIVASTATIRRADRQCKNLYDRSIFQFPPQGLDSSDSFFAVEDREESGRIYLGLLPTAASSPLTAQIRAVVAMQQGVPIVAVGSAQDETIDPYWTLVQYYSSLKELGRAATFVTSDIPEFLPTMHRRYDLKGDARRYMNTAEELTSRKNEDEIPKIIKRLEMTYSTGARWASQALDTVLATNMISVGVDIDRLGLMMIVTQPKSTAEYIQASSRVGRSKKAPGLILTLFNASRPRDRSHYEQFRSFHEAFYKFVEPTSVTPFAVPALERALHAVLVIAGRHIAGWAKPSDVDLTDASFEGVVNFLRERVRRIDPDHMREFEEILERRLGEWSDRSPGIWGLFRNDAEERVLMRVAGTEARAEDPESWETLTSMRNVDVECGAAVVPRYAVQTRTTS